MPGPVSRRDPLWFPLDLPMVARMSASRFNAPLVAVGDRNNRIACQGGPVGRAGR